MFSITDTGIGIKEEDISRLFNYFSQLDIFITKRFQGTGLELAISKNLIELMGGEISVESQYGIGSTCLDDNSKRMFMIYVSLDITRGDSCEDSEE